MDSVSILEISNLAHPLDHWIAHALRFETFTLNTDRFEPGNNAPAQKKIAVKHNPGLASAGVPDA